MNSGEDKARVLVVDDSEILLAGLKKNLGQAGFILKIARSGKEALEILPDFNPDIILLDVLMPGMDGYETCVNIRSNARFKDVPVLFMTALNDSSSKLKGFDVGGVDYITKPFESDELLARCRTHLKILRLRRQLSAEVLAKDSAIAELDAFSHTVAHDLKNPLSGIIGLADCLLDIEDASVIAKSIKESGEQCFRIVEEILLLATIRGEPVNLEQVDMKQCLQKATTSLSWLLTKKGAVCDEPEGLPPCVGRSSWISQVWMNFISNAAIYGGPSPHISIGFEENGSFNRYWVEDNGPGIQDDKKAHLFIPFSRLGQVKLEGTGLGLSIVKRIMDRLDGEVGVEDSISGGAMFYFDLPSGR